MRARFSQRQPCASSRVRTAFCAAFLFRSPRNPGRGEGAGAALWRPRPALLASVEEAPEEVQAVTWPRADPACLIPARRPGSLARTPLGASEGAGSVGTPSQLPAGG